MSDVKLGQPPAESAQRDAIHVAIAPVIAEEDLHPGDHVGVRDGKAFLAARNAIGIVDPFRKSDVLRGERCWVCLYQNTIVGMRHHWSHPSFSDAPPQGSRAPASEQWLRDFAREHYHDDYNSMMDEARTGCVTFNNSGTPCEDMFWVHFNMVTGLNIEGGYFSCSC
jgi:hypothetical protein